MRQDQRRDRGQVENEAVAEHNLVEMVVQLQRQAQEQQTLINNLQANANRVEVPIDPPAAQPVQIKEFRQQQIMSPCICDSSG